jgi:serine/threonine-protein kinase HipA
MTTHRKAEILAGDRAAGLLSEDEEGYAFVYYSEYLESGNAMAVSLTLPLTEETYKSRTMFPFFDGLIPEGWLLDITTDIWKIDVRDRMGLLLACCRDCIGAVSVVPAEGD